MGVASKVLATFTLSTTAGVQLIYKTRAKPRQPWIAGDLGGWKAVEFSGFAQAKK